MCTFISRPFILTYCLVCSNFFFFIKSILDVLIYWYIWCVCVWCVWMSGNNLKKPLLSSNYVGPRNQTQMFEQGINYMRMVKIDNFIFLFLKETHLFSPVQYNVSSFVIFCFQIRCDFTMLSIKIFIMKGYLNYQSPLMIILIIW